MPPARPPAPAAQPAHLPPAYPPPTSHRDLERRVTEALARLRGGEPAPGLLVTGPAGSGRSRLLARAGELALAQGWTVVDRTVLPGAALFPAVAQLVRDALYEIATPRSWLRSAARTGALLAALKRADASLPVSVHLPAAALRLADGAPIPTGVAASDLAQLLLELGAAAADQDTGVLLLLDDAHHAEDGLGDLVTALRAVVPAARPITVVASGTAQLHTSQAGTGPSSLDPVLLGPLPRDEALDLLAAHPALGGRRLAPDAADLVLRRTRGWPQLVAVTATVLRRVPGGAELTADDVRRAGPLVDARLDQALYAPRTAGLTPRQLSYLRAMADHGPGPVTSGAVAATLGHASSAPLGRVRDEVLRKRLIYSPRTGSAAFAVPMLDEHLRRVLPAPADGGAAGD